MKVRSKIKWKHITSIKLTKLIAISRVLRAFSNGRTDGPTNKAAYTVKCTHLKKYWKEKMRWKATSLFVQTRFLIWQLGTYEMGDFNSGAKKLLSKWAKMVNSVVFWRFFVIKNFTTKISKYIFFILLLFLVWWDLSMKML